MGIKIKDLPEAQSVSNDDYLILDNGSYTQKVKASNISGGKVSRYTNISVSGIPTSISYQSWDEQQLYGYKLDVTVNGLTENSMIENIVLSQTLLAQVAYIVTTSANKLTFYFQGNDEVSGQIILLIVNEVSF